MNPITLLRPRRPIVGASAILLPFRGPDRVDWVAFEAHLARTLDHGLIPAVNMDTGYVNLIDLALQEEVLHHTQSVVGGRPFFAGAFVSDHPSSRFDRDGYVSRFGAINQRGGIPVLFPSFGLNELADDPLVLAFAELGRRTDQFLAFELGREFAPCGRIYSIAVFRALMEIQSCSGVKHSSLQREPEWLRLIERDRLRPEFRIYTGNDLAIDMVMYGSDYLLGLSTFAPDLFAVRDRAWANNDPAFHERNDRLQYLGSFAFRAPVPAYKHSAAMFLRMRGWISDDRTHAGCPQRPDSDRAVLRTIASRLGILPNAE